MQHTNYKIQGSQAEVRRLEEKQEEENLGWPSLQISGSNGTQTVLKRYSNSTKTVLKQYSNGVVCHLSFVKIDRDCLKAKANGVVQ